MVRLYAAWYNFRRIQKTLKCSPAMSAKLSETLWSMVDVVGLIDAVAPAPAARDPYKPRQPKAGTTSN
jgi:hypothetical protein